MYIVICKLSESLWLRSVGNTRLKSLLGNDALVLLSFSVQSFSWILMVAEKSYSVELPLVIFCCDLYIVLLLILSG